MSRLLPYLIIKAPDGSETRITLGENRKTRYTLGRLPEVNDIALPEPDVDPPIISRFHCVLERQTYGWILIDQSSNGTIIEREGVTKNLHDLENRQVALNRGDIIIIHNWQISFQDDDGTGRIGVGSGGIKWPLTIPVKRNTPFVYVVRRSTLFYVEDGKRTEIPNLRPQVIDFLECMAEKNLQNSGQPTLCSYEEIIRRVWGDEYGGNDHAGLAREVRAVFESRGLTKDQARQLLETRTKRGYILHLDCEK